MFLRRLAIFAALFASLLRAAASAGTVLYVDQDSLCGASNQPPCDGSTWCRAYKRLSQAVQVAVAGDTVRVAGGRYAPTMGGLSDPREATFRLNDGVTVQGGYAGCRTDPPDSRSITHFETVLSGDLSANDGPGGIGNGENAYHVLTVGSAVLDGLTISGGNANGAGFNGAGFSMGDGGGIYQVDGQLTLNQCTVRQNAARDDGAAIYSRNGSVRFHRCHITGGIWTDWFSYGVAAEETTFTESGIAIGGAANLRRCRFVSSRVSLFTFCCFGTSTVTSAHVAGLDATIENSLFMDSTLSVFQRACEVRGCAFVGGSSPQIVASAVDPMIPGYSPARVWVSNTTLFNGTTYGIDVGYSDVYIRNSIVWGAGTGAPQFRNHQGGVNVDYSCIRGLTGTLGGVGNIGSDPLIELSDDGKPRLGMGSPCINTGDPAFVADPGETDLDGQPRVHHDRVDMGSDEYVGTLPQLDLSIERVEVYQSIQVPVDVLDLNDDTGALPLVSGRRTLARVYITWPGSQETVSGVQGSLRVFDGDRRVAEVASWWREPYPQEFARGSFADRRRYPERTLNFVFSAPESDAINLFVEVNPAGDNRLLESRYDNNVYPSGGHATQLKFVCRVSPRIAFQPLDYRWNLDPLTPNLPTRDAIEAQKGFLRAVFPWSDGETLEPIELAPRFSTAPVNTVAMNGLLFLLRHTLKPPPDYLIGLLPENTLDGSIGIGGMGGICFREAWAVASEGDTSLVAHELAHNLGVCHPTTNTCGAAPGCGGWALLPCGPVPGDARATYPGVQGFGERWPWLTGPNQVGLMSYCRDEARWIDPVTYRHVADSLDTDCNTLHVRAADGAGLIVHGAYDPVAHTIMLQPVVEESAIAPTPNDPGGVLRLTAFARHGETSAMAYDVAFSPTRLGESESVEAQRAFGIVIPRESVDGAVVSAIEVRDVGSGQLLSRQERSMSAPEVRFLTPLEGADIVSPQEIAWEGVDQDGDPLWHALTYSWDGGLSWLPLVVDSAETSFVLTPSSLPASSPGGGVLRITATDGFNTTRVDLAELSVGANHPPRVEILHIDDGADYVAGTLVFLQAAVSDPEDAALPDEAVTWSSKVNGSLGTGRSLSISDLSIGIHDITVMAFDSEGMSASDEVTIEILPRPRGAAPGDFNYDGFVDLTDLAALAPCLNGPEQAPHPGCTWQDSDSDDDVDLSEFRALQLGFCPEKVARCKR